jgi:ABC-type transport system involved in multi-copper enzyme maturation permease subunit
MARREPSDWLSPVLVKEMRQGLKSRVFTLAFLVIQVAMLCAALVVLTMNGGQQMREASAVMFWGFTLSMVVVLMPLMGLNSLASELKDQTFELVLLTRLTAWRIVSGKWASLVGQIALVTSGLLPYLVLRYYLGGVELLLELLLIPLMLFLAAALCAVTLYASTYTSGLARLAVLGVQGLVFVFGLGMATSLGRRGTSGTLATGGLDGAAWVVFGCALALCVAILLQAAATRIAPPAENHAAVKRGLAVVLVLLALVPMQGELQLVYLGALTPVLGLVGLDACSEGIAAAPTAYLPYARWRFPGLGALLYPGWPGGLAFTAVIGALVTVRIVATSAVEAGDAALAYLGFVAAVAVPVALSRLGRKGRRFVVGWAVAFHGLALTLGAVAGQLADVAGLERDAGVAAVSPLAAVVLSADNELASDVGLVLVAQLGWLVLAALILARFGRDEVAEVSMAARRARGLPNP